MGQGKPGEGVERNSQEVRRVGAWSEAGAGVGMENSYSVVG